MSDIKIPRNLAELLKLPAVEEALSREELMTDELTTLLKEIARELGSYVPRAAAMLGKLGFNDSEPEQADALACLLIAALVCKRLGWDPEAFEMLAAGAFGGVTPDAAEPDVDA